MAREKNQKKQQEQAKKKGASDKNGNKGLSLEERKHRYVFLLTSWPRVSLLCLLLTPALPLWTRDAEMMRLKQQKAAEKAASG